MKDAYAHVTRRLFERQPTSIGIRPCSDVLFEYPSSRNNPAFPSTRRWRALAFASSPSAVSAAQRGVRAFEFTVIQASYTSIRVASVGLALVTWFFPYSPRTDHCSFCLPGNPVSPLGRAHSRRHRLTIAHSATLIASATISRPISFGFRAHRNAHRHFHRYHALENIVGGSSFTAPLDDGFRFGLVHGFGFSFALRQSLQFAGSHLLTSLLSFNVGVELGQLLVLVLLIPVATAPLPLRMSRNAWAPSSCLRS